MNLNAHLNAKEAIGPADIAVFRKLVADLRALPEREPSPELTDRILAAVDEERARPRRRRPLAPWWVGAVAASLIAALSLMSVYLVPSRVAPVMEDDGATWLVEAQEADGSWCPAKHGGVEAYRPALTALSALALARNKHPRYAEPLKRACAALAAMQTADGAFGGEGRVRLYNHALTLFALSALYQGESSLKPVLERAVAFSRANQTVQGGWDYEPDSEGNAALTAWQIRGLSSLSRRGFQAADVPLRKGLRWLRGLTRDDGSVAYTRQSPNRSDGLTALTAYTLITAGAQFPGLPELGRLAAGSLRANANPDEGADCYRDYAKTLAFASAGADTLADSVRQRMIAQHKARQRDQWEPVGGRLYTTAFTLLAAR